MKVKRADGSIGFSKPEPPNVLKLKGGQRLARIKCPFRVSTAARWVPGYGQPPWRQRGPDTGPSVRPVCASLCPAEKTLQKCPPSKVPAAAQITRIFRVGISRGQWDLGEPPKALQIEPGVVAGFPGQRLRHSPIPLEDPEGEIALIRKLETGTPTLGTENPTVPARARGSVRGNWAPSPGWVGGTPEGGRGAGATARALHLGRRHLARSSISFFLC